jgi:hypothetical protein
MLAKLLNKQESKLNLKPIPRGFYAFNVERAGDFLIYVEMQTDAYKFLYVPGAEPFYLSIEDFTKSIETGVLSFVEQLPEDIYNESLLLSCPK